MLFYDRNVEKAKLLFSALRQAIGHLRLLSLKMLSLFLTISL